MNRLQLVHRETGRLKDILDDFLRYAGRMEVDRQPIDLNRLVGEMVDFFTPQAQLNKVQMRFRPAAEPVMVPADAKLIKQALLNLLLNAVQAMAEKGGSSNELILSAYRKDDEAVIEVIDTAGGMPPSRWCGFSMRITRRRSRGRDWGWRWRGALSKSMGGGLPSTAKWGRDRIFGYGCLCE